MAQINAASFNANKSSAKWTYSLVGANNTQKQTFGRLKNALDENFKNAALESQSHFNAVISRLCERSNQISTYFTSIRSRYEVLRGVQYTQLDDRRRADHCIEVKQIFYGFRTVIGNFGVLGGNFTEMAVAADYRDDLVKILTCMKYTNQILSGGDPADFSGTSRIAKNHSDQLDEIRYAMEETKEGGSRRVVSDLFKEKMVDGGTLIPAWDIVCGSYEQHLAGKRNYTGVERWLRETYESATLVNYRASAPYVARNGTQVRRENEISATLRAAPDSSNNADDMRWNYCPNAPTPQMATVDRLFHCIYALWLANDMRPLERAHYDKLHSWCRFSIRNKISQEEIKKKVAESKQNFIRNLRFDEIEGQQLEHPYQNPARIFVRRFGNGLACFAPILNLAQLLNVGGRPMQAHICSLWANEREVARAFSCTAEYLVTRGTFWIMAQCIRGTTHASDWAGTMSGSVGQFRIN